MRKKQTSFLDREITIDMRFVGLFVLIAFILHYLFMRHLSGRLRRR